MAVGDRQKLITEIVAEVFGEPAVVGKSFPWLRNRHRSEEFGSLYPVVCEIYAILGGGDVAVVRKRKGKLTCDAFFGGKLNFILEFDEVQHFSSARLETLKLLPSDVPLGFSLSDYTALCKKYSGKADAYRSKKRTKDFDFIGGRTAQRAYFDAFRDLLPGLHGLRPTIRVSEFEVEAVRENNTDSRDLLRKLLKPRL